jgi:hypothetical protein
MVGLTHWMLNDETTLTPVGSAGRRIGSSVTRGIPAEFDPRKSARKLPTTTVVVESTVPRKGA